MNARKKEMVKTSLLILMILSIIGSFVLFFLQYYKVAFGLAGIFMFLATFLGQWSMHKNHDYVYRNLYKGNKDRYR
ncbi:hypothetical protein [Bacillus sp. FJAT-47783]|uniref:hypothetical protein n=1 Tax=Bacillus sp. FJAT-47783 TaxID=2922712 RepID=UPI001FAB53F3|nr:hypothetical protein [Bacillus sp. FJAT-47783]